MKEIRDIVLTFVAINVFLHLNYPEFMEWSRNKRSAMFDSIGNALSSITLEHLMAFIFMMLIAATIISWTKWIISKLP